MPNTSILYALSTVLLLATVSCAPLKESLEFRLNNRLQHLSGPVGSSHHYETKTLVENDEMVREVRNDKKKTRFEPYLMFKARPPVELTLLENSNYVLECQVSGSPKPQVHWEKNGIKIPQGQATYDESRQYGQLGLMMVKSRLFLDCLTESDQASYACVADTDVENSVPIVTETKLTVEPLGPNYFSKESEMFGNQNSIDYGGKGINANSAYAIESKLSGCQKSKFSPARIHFYTITLLENIGQDGIVHCRAIGFPKPEIKWSINDEDVVSDFRKYEMLSTGDLLIRNVTFDDMGKYKCTASNQFGSDSVDKLFFYPTLPTKNNPDN